MNELRHEFAQYGEALEWARQSHADAYACDHFREMRWHLNQAEEAREQARQSWNAAAEIGRKSFGSLPSAAGDRILWWGSGLWGRLMGSLRLSTSLMTGWVINKTDHPAFFGSGEEVDDASPPPRWSSPEPPDYPMPTAAAFERTRQAQPASYAPTREGDVCDKAVSIASRMLEALGAASPDKIAPLLEAFTAVDYPLTRMYVLSTSAPDLEGRTPLEAAFQGDMDAAVACIARYGEQC